MSGFTGIRRGGTEFASRDDPDNIEVWAGGEWQASWNGYPADRLDPELDGVIGNMMDKVFEAGQKARSKEILKLLGGR